MRQLICLIQVSVVDPSLRYDVDVACALGVYVRNRPRRKKRLAMNNKQFLRRVRIKE